MKKFIAYYGNGIFSTSMLIGTLAIQEEDNRRKKNIHK